MTSVPMLFRTCLLLHAEYVRPSEIVNQRKHIKETRVSKVVVLPLHDTFLGALTGLTPLFLFP